MYVGIAAVLHVGVMLVARTLDSTARAASARSLRG
jgi:hypothetical protein